MCIHCRHGHTIFYEKRNGLYFSYCKNCNSRRYSRNVSEAVNYLTKPHIGCAKCYGELIAKHNLIWTEAYQKSRGIRKTENGYYQVKCPKGHVREYKALGSAVSFVNKKLPCVVCKLKQLQKEFKASFKPLEGELWKRIPGFDNYKISSLGRCYNMDNGKFLRPQFVSKYRYNAFCLHGSQGPKWNYVARLVAAAFVKNDDPEHKIEVDHIDENKANNKSTNLQFVTHHCNVLKAHANGRFPLHRKRKYLRST